MTRGSAGSSPVVHPQNGGPRESQVRDGSDLHGLTGSAELPGGDSDSSAMRFNGRRCPWGQTVLKTVAGVIAEGSIPSPSAGLSHSERSLVG